MDSIYILNSITHNNDLCCILFTIIQFNYYYFVKFMKVDPFLSSLTTSLIERIHKTDRYLDLARSKNSLREKFRGIWLKRFRETLVLFSVVSFPTDEPNSRSFERSVPSSFTAFSRNINRTDAKVSKGRNAAKTSEPKFCSSWLSLANDRRCFEDRE